MASTLAAELSRLIAEYGLKIVRVDESEALLIGPAYALQFLADRDSLDVTYIERDKRGPFSAYTLRQLVMQRFTQEDRAHYGAPLTVKEKVIASLRVYASGLANRCQDVLGGEKSWLRRDSWSLGAPNSIVQKILQVELPEQAFGGKPR